MRYYPYVELIIITLFIFFSYILFSIARRSEQNRVWSGLAKETAHQLGTPLTSLLAWVDYLKTKSIAHADEIEKDVKRLEVITNRFSRIGSESRLELTDVSVTVKETIEYLKSRTSQKVKILFLMSDEIQPVIPLSPSLFTWVIENLIRNAIDAMSGEGNIKVEIKDLNDYIVIDVNDSGKGIAKSNFKNVFKTRLHNQRKGVGTGIITM